MTQKTYSDFVGDGGSMILEQVMSQKGRISKSLSRVKHMIAVGSAKGGVGKSTLTMQIGATLNQLGFKTTLLDADFNGPSLARLSHLENIDFFPGQEGMVVPKTKSGLGVLSFGSIVPESEAVDFKSVARGESHTWRATKEFTVLGDFLANTAWGELDFLLIDLPPGAERSFQFAEFFGKETAHVLVTLPSELSHGVVSRGVAALGKTESPVLGYVENMSGYFCTDCGKIKPLFSAGHAADLGIPLLGKVPFDPELAHACDQGRSIESFPESPAALAVRNVVENILEKLKVLHP